MRAVVLVDALGWDAREIHGGRFVLRPVTREREGWVYTRYMALRLEDREGYELFLHVEGPLDGGRERFR